MWSLVKIKNSKRKLVVFFTFIYFVCPQFKELAQAHEIRQQFSEIVGKPKTLSRFKKIVYEDMNPNFFWGGDTLITSLREPFGTIWPYHFSKADDGYGSMTVI